MFAKLLKREMKATAGSIGLLSLCALGMGVIGGFMLRYIISAADEQQANTMVTVFGLFQVFVILGLVAYAVGGELFLAYQFYKDKFTDQGYLTFTLPAHSWQIFLSSMVNIMLWSLIIGLVTIVAVLAMFLIGIIGTPLTQEVQSSGPMGPSLKAVFGEMAPSMVVSAISQFISSTVMMMTAIILGSVVAKKHKILASIAMYYVCSLVYGMLSTRLLVVAMFMSEQPNLTNIYNVQTILQLAVAMGGFLLSCWLMDNKLNLP